MSGLVGASPVAQAETRGMATKCSVRFVGHPRVGASMLFSPLVKNIFYEKEESRDATRGAKGVGL